MDQSTKTLVGNQNALSVTTDGNTDFWQEIFYGFKRNNGHAWLSDVDGDFTLEADIDGNYEVLSTKRV